MPIYSPQLATALIWTNEMIEKHSMDKNNLTLTGHSLGGILTQYVGSELKIKEYAYNPWGINTLFTNIKSSINETIDKILNNIGISNKDFAKNNIYTISYQDEGLINGDSLSNFATGIISQHLGHFIPIIGENVNGINGHFMGTLNTAIVKYDEIVTKFDNFCRYEDITQMYLSTAIIHGNGYERVQEELSKIGVYGANNNSLHLDVITKDSSVTSIFSGSNLTTPALYALVNLNPFIVSNINSNAYSELEKYKDEFSENYIKDKAKMFEAVLKYPNTNPVNFSYFDIKTKKELYSNYPGSIGVFGTNLDETIQARSNFNNRIYALAGNDSIEGGKYNNYIEAGSGNDIIDLRDSKGENVVYGGVNNGKDNDDDGNDIIYGGKGKDTMYGGSGFDSYYAGNGDTIEDDEKGQGFVYFNSNSPLIANKSISNNAYAYTNPNAKNGFENLKELDSNNDDIIDEKDKEFTNLLLWQDKNSNGISETDELIKLSDKVKSINLNYTKNGNTEISTATLNNGTKVKADDIWFKVNYKDTEEIIDESQIPFEIKALPNVRAFGNIHSLHYAMANNETLATMVNLYLLMDSKTRKENLQI